MASDVEHPWFPEVMDLLDLRRRDRVLLITAQHPSYVEAVAQKVGSCGDILVLEPDKDAAAEVAEAMPRVEIIALAPTGQEMFGTFDALLACPLSTPDWPLELWAGVTTRNLRPGGRFAIDLPGEELCEDLSSCWVEVGGSEKSLLPIRGPAPDHSISNHLTAPMIAFARYPSASWASDFRRSGLRHKKAGSPDSPAESSSQQLRTGRSLPVASHPASRRRSYLH